MSRGLKYLVVAAVFLASCGSGFEAYPAPPVSAPYLESAGAFDLADHLESDGRPILLNLWASWCGPCRDEMPALDAASASRPDVAFIGVAVLDIEADARAFLEEVPVRFPIAWDDDGSVAEALGVNGLPVTMVIDENGMVTREHRGPLDLDDVDGLLPREGE